MSQNFIFIVVTSSLPVLYENLENKGVELIGEGFSVVSLLIKSRANLGQMNVPYT
jgi:hypothetical protein